MSAANDGFTASERADIALLRSAGVIAGDAGNNGRGHVVPVADGGAREGSLSAQEHADMAFLRAIGVVKPGSTV